jgi:hypothetical protein
MEADAKAIERIAKLRKNLSNIEYINELRKAGNEKEIDPGEAKAAHDRIVNELSAGGYVVILPFAKKINEISDVARIDKEALLNGLKAKAGPVWEKIIEKNGIFEFYLKNIQEITALSNVVNRLPGAERDRVALAVEAGNLEADMELPYLQKEIEKALNRVGIPCLSNANRICPGKIEDHEIKVVVKDKSVWIPHSQKEIIEAAVKEYESIGVQIQVKNAKRQIMQFEGQDEQDFQTLQLRYLELIKKMDDIITKYGS